MAEAVWALKAIFYAIDHGLVGFVRVEDILTALSDSRWARGASASDLPRLHQASDNAMVIPDAATAAPLEAHVHEDAETLLDRLSRLGVGVRSSGERCDSVDARSDGAGLVHYIRHLLAPPVRVDLVRRIDN